MQRKKEGYPDEIKEMIGANQNEVAKIERGEQEINRELAVHIGEKLKNDYKRFLIFVFVLFISISCFADTCQDWFNKSGIKLENDCEMRCVVAKVGMDSFMCHDKCEKLCKRKPAPASAPKSFKKSLLKSLILYPGLTAKEKSLIVENPKEAIIVFLQKNTSEDSVQRNFPEGLIDDESDAFRHFVWSGLLLKELGVERAKIYLDAHESGALETAEAKAMDLANNKTGTSVAAQLLKENRLDLPNLEKEALQYLRDHKLVVIKPQGYLPKEPIK